MTIQEEIERQKEIIEAVTEGPWKWDAGNLQVETIPNRYTICDVESEITGDLNGAHPDYDYFSTGEFIAEARTCWPRVLKALEIAMQDLRSIKNGVGVKDGKCKNLAKACLEDIQKILKREEE